MNGIPDTGISTSTGSDNRVQIELSTRRIRATFKLNSLFCRRYESHTRDSE
jgi:hypothetical protein